MGVAAWERGWRFPGRATELAIRRTRPRQIVPAGVRAPAVFVARMLLALAILGGLVAGCAEVSLEPLSASANAGELENRTLDDPRLHRFVLASLSGETEPGNRISWDLTTLTLAAVYYHPDLDIARAKLALSRAAVVTAEQRPNPILNFAAVFNSAAVGGAIPPGAIPLTIGPVISLIVEAFDKREHRVGQAKQLGDAARWGLATAGWRVRTGVRTALLNLWAARQRMALTGRRRDLQEELVRLLEKRLEIGQAGALDVARERIARTQVAVDLRAIERAADKAEAELANAVGVPVRALAGVTLAFDAFTRVRGLPPGVADGELRRRALTGTTEMQAALAEYEAAQSALQLAVANQYPDLTLGPGYTYDSGVNQFSLSPTIELPVFNRNQGQIAEALARRQQAAANVTALQARIIAAIDSALAAYRAGQREALAADALVAGARRREDQVAASFRAGQVDRLTLVAAALETAAVGQSRLAATVARLEAIGALEDALQHPLYGPTAILSPPPIGPRSGSRPPSETPS